LKKKGLKTVDATGHCRLNRNLGSQGAKGRDYEKFLYGITLRSILLKKIQIPDTPLGKGQGGLRNYAERFLRRRKKENYKHSKDASPAGTQHPWRPERNLKRAAHLREIERPALITRKRGAKVLSILEGA